jgi:hypothetical protein
MGAPAAGTGAFRGLSASSAMCLSKIAVFSSSSSQSMSIDAVDGPLLAVIGTVGVRPKAVDAIGLADGFGIGRPGMAGAEGMGRDAPCDRLLTDGGIGSGATEVTGGGGAGWPLEIAAAACVGGEADGGGGGGAAAGNAAEDGSGGGPPEKAGGGGGGCPPKPGA